METFILRKKESKAKRSRPSIAEMNPADDSVTSSPNQMTPSPHTNLPSINQMDLDDIDDDDDADDDCSDSIDEIQHILQTFGTSESSPLTLVYFDSRRYEIMYEIMNVERQFEQLKNTLYDESVALIDQKLLSIQNEEAPEYQEELKKLHDDMQLRLEIAKQRRHIELESLENSYQAELLSLQQTLENDKFLLYHQMQEDIQRKIDELETLKYKTSLCSNILQEMFPQDHQPGMLLSKKRFEASEAQKQASKENKKRKVNFMNGSTKPTDKDNLAIFYQLSDLDIIEDWALIQASLGKNDNGEAMDEQEQDDDDDEDHLESVQSHHHLIKQDQGHYDENRV